MHGVSEMRILVARGRRASILSVRERSQRLLVRKGLRDRAKAKARISYPKMGDTSVLLANQGRELVSSATSLDILDEIALRGKDPRTLRHNNPNYRWNMHRRSLFLLTPAQAKGNHINPKVRHRHRLSHIQVREAKARVEVRYRAHKPGLWGSKGVSMPLYHRLSV